MKKSIVRVMALITLTILTACDYIEKRGFDNDRSDSLYRAAMEEYCAGRLDSSIKKLTEVCAKDPSNASARFQLAYLLQDYAKDFLGATCAYREYLSQRPNSEKADLARSRLANCERELANALATKYGLNAVADYQKRIKEITDELAKRESKVTSLEGELDASQKRVESLQSELTRAREIFRAEFEAENESSVVSANEIKDAKSLLDDMDDDESAKPMISAKPTQNKANSTVTKKAEPSIIEAPRIEHPDTYIVQDGDTLYKIAVRFYGRSSAWSKIREANKAIISTDGRIRTGQRLVLP